MILLSQIEIGAKFYIILFVVWAIYKTDLRTSAVVLGLILNAVLRLCFMSLFGNREWRPLFKFEKKLYMMF